MLAGSGETMTEEIANLFEGTPIQVVNELGEFWFPLPDLTEAWGVSKDTLSHQIERNKDLFSGMSGEKYVTYPTGEIQEICVNERGLYTLIGRLNTDRLKNPHAKEAILRFQRWVPELIQRYRKHELVQAPAGQDIRAELQEARELAVICGRSPESFQAVILRKHGKGELASELQLSGNIVHGETGWYNVTGLVSLCNDPGLTPERLNKWLENYREGLVWAPFQYRDGRLWRLTRRGMEHGREYQFNLGNGHSEPRISWRESVLYACGLKKHVAADQTALPARAGAY